MRVSIFAKIAIMTCFAILCTTLPTLYVVNKEVRHGFDEESDSALTAATDVVREFLRDYRRTMRGYAYQVANNQIFIDAVKARDKDKVRTITKKILEESTTIDTIVITDDKGIIIARAHADTSGDSAAYQLNVQKSLKGATSAGAEPISTVGMSLRAGVPVYSEGTLVGTLSIGTTLSSKKYLENMKKLLGMEVVIFNGETVLASSFEEKNAMWRVGDKIQNPTLLENVLRGKKEHRDSMPAQSMTYKLSAIPLISSDDTVPGMFMLARSTALMEKDLQSVLYAIVSISFVFIVIMSIVATVYARFVISRPLAEITKLVKDVVDDKAELSAKINDSSGDEVGALAHQINRLTGKVFVMLCNIEGFKNLVNAIPDPVFAVDENYKIIMGNTSLVKAVGYEKIEQVEGKNINEVFKTNFFGSEKCGLRQVIATKQPYVTEVHSLQLGGKNRDVRGLCDVVRDCSGEINGYLEVASDVTLMMEQERQSKAQMEQIQAINAQLLSIAEEVVVAANTISTQTQAVQKGANTQSQLMQETQTAIEQISDSIMGVARNASQASEQAGQGQAKAGEGSGVVDSAMQSINTVSKQAETLRDNMKILGEQAEAIGKIMNVISDIADQTNLLALNAAIEAARAGDAGRGFAVVADEVRKLAEKTMGATLEVRSAIESIQAGTANNITSMGQVTDSVGEATELSSKSGEALKEIVHIVAETASQITAIAAASEEQSASSEEIRHRVDAVTKLSEDTVEQLRAAAEASAHLTELAKQLRKVAAG